MKKKLFIIAGATIIALLLIFGVNYLFSLKKVSFTLHESVTGATIYTSEEHKVKHITSSSSTLLTKGGYYAIPEGENLSDKPISFTVRDEDMTVAINPPYTEEYLQKLLEAERSAVSAAIAAKYPSLYPDYTLTNGTFYEHGDWFGGLLEPKVSDRRQRKDPYRIVLHKEGNTWKVIRRPEYILTSSRYNEVPVDILRQINMLSQ